jgi:hypothetical protein
MAQGDVEKGSGAAGADPQASADGGDMAAVIGGEALAVADDTLATGSVSLDVKDKGPVTKVHGTATFTAVAQASDGDPGSAYADTFADVEGADKVRIKVVNSTVTDEDGLTVVTSTLRLKAIDNDHVDHVKDPVIHVITKDHPGDVQFDSTDGNAAAVSADANATGDATYALTHTDSLTTDTMSSVAGEAYGLIA